MNYKRLNISLPETLADDLDIAAGKAYKTRSEFIKDLILYHFAKEGGLHTRGRDIEELAENVPAGDLRQVIQNMQDAEDAVDSPSIPNV